MKVLKKVLWIVLCVVLFIGVFAGSSYMKFTSLIGLGGSGYTLQGIAAKTVISPDEITKETISVSYITNEGTVETRPIILYRPKDAKGDLPLIYVPHYAIEENSADFQSYIKHGWAAASPVFKEKYNGQLAGNDLVFNNAALFTLRHTEGIDRQRIAVVGGSAGGYTTV